jgi:type IV pilus assembly protein PilB
MAQETSLAREEELAEGFASKLSLPRLHLASATIQSEALAKVPEKVARKCICLPVKLDGRSLVAAFANPTDYQAIRDIEFASGSSVRPLVATRTEVLDGIERYYSPDDKLRELVEHIVATDDFKIVRADADSGGGEAPEAGSEATPVVKLCNVMIYDAVRTHASDVHIEPELNDVQVRMRVDGVLRPYNRYQKWLHDAVISRLKILARLDIAERRRPQDGRIGVQFRKSSIDLRVSTLPTHYGEKAVLRLLGASSAPTLDSIGIGGQDRVALETAVRQAQGMIVVTGPTGSGKTSTLYALLLERKSPEVNIVTIEDPIEYQLAGISQVQVNARAGLTFAGALRSILRQDPDVILLGEIRDGETAEAAFQAAMTGHLVLTTLHTNGSIATLARLHELGVEPTILGTTVTAILAQRLVRRVCDGCRADYSPAADDLRALGLDRSVSYSHGTGCDRCSQTGFAGRVGIFEILRITPALRELVQARASEAAIRTAATQAGTRFLIDRAIEAVRSGLSTVEEVLRVIQVETTAETRCPHCGEQLPPEASSCPSCLQPLKRDCAACGQELKLEWRACPFCGAATPAAAPSPGQAPVETPVSRVPKVLVVDDDPAMQVAIKAALRQLPVKVEISGAGDGVEGLAAIERDRPDLVVLDVMMPRMDGFAVCERMRSDARTAFIPILMLTRSDDESSRTRGYLVGTDDYMPKPFSVPELAARVSRLLRRTYGM